MRHRLLRPISITSASFLIAGLAVVCLSGDTPVHRHASTLMTSAGSPGTASMRAYLNPETGKLETGPSPVAIQFDFDTEQALRRDTSGLVEEHHADGTVVLDLQGRFQSVAMVHRTANGRIFVCTDDENRAKNMLTVDPSAAKAPEVK
jgi:hypothetical protein